MPSSKDGRYQLFDKMYSFRKGLDWRYLTKIVTKLLKIEFYCTSK